MDVRAAISLVYNDLCKQENLSKCLHGRTHKKSFNGMIWNRVPKGNHASYDQGQMLGAATAANAAPQKSSH